MNQNDYKKLNSKVCDYACRVQFLNKRICASLILLLGLSFGLMAQYTLLDSDVVVTSGVITSCSYNFAEKNIIIPSLLDGQTVVGIEDEDIFSPDAFMSKGITQLLLPPTLVNIGDYAFRGNNLDTIIIPSGVQFIGEGAFNNNSFGFDDVEIPNSVLFIGKSAFSLNAVDSITLPNIVQSGFQFWIDGNGQQFPGGTKVKYTGLEYRAKITYTLNDDDVVVDENGIITECSYDFENGFKDIIIPEVLDSRTVLGITDKSYNGIFEDKELESVELPSTIKFIGQKSFDGNNLKSILLPAGVEIIGDNSFSSNDLDDIELPNSVIYIGKNAFYWNNSEFDSITLPIPPNSEYEYWLSSNDELILPGTKVEMESYVSLAAKIYYTLKDEDVYVSNGSIDTCYYDFSIKNIIIPEVLDGQIITAIGDGYEDQYFNLHGVFARKDIKEIQLPANLEKIGDYAFCYNDIDTVILPDEVKYIGTDAYTSNYDVEGIVLPSPTKTGFELENWTNTSGTVFNADDIITNFFNTAYTANFTLSPGTSILSLSGDLSFGNVDENTTAIKAFTISNNGNASFTVSGINLPEGFTSNWTGGIIAAGASQEVTISFLPTEVKAYSGVVTVLSNATSGPNTILADGVGIAVASILISGDLDFGNVDIYTSISKLFTVSNTGSAVLTVSSIDLPSGFVANWTNGEIAAGANQEINITFAPTETKTYLGVIKVNSNASSGYDTISAIGIGIGHVAIELEGTLEFGDVNVNAAATKNLIIRNVGNQTLDITSIDLPEGFSIDWNNGSIAVGAEKVVVITFSPDEGIEYSGVMYVNSNSEIGLSSLSISGTGIKNSATQNIKKNALNIYPIPVITDLQISADNVSRVEIYSINGKIVESKTMNESVLTIDLSDYDTGLYILKAYKTSGEVVNRRIIKD
jgi:hypothetical protein